MIQGQITNPLVRFFVEKEDCLNKKEILHERKPALNIFLMDQETLDTHVNKVWPDEIEQTCEVLYRKYMKCLCKLDDKSTQNFTT